jgi:cyclohexanone monooxygenase
MVLPINEESALEVSKERRKSVYEDRWKKGGVPFIAAFQDLNFDREANETAAEFVQNKIKSLVEDSAIAKLLTPKYPIGCKRLAIDSNYYETFNKPNISLIDLNTEPLEEFVSNGLSTFKNFYELDVIILATGFDAMTGTLFNIDIQGKNNIKLKNKWADGPKTYLGLTTESFPNFFIISGPGSPSVLTNMIVSIEQHVNWIFDCFKFMKKNKHSSIEASLQAEQEWVKHNQDVSVNHVRSSCSSWYMGANIKGKARIFMPYVGGYANYVKKCNQVSQNNYEGFIIK